MTKTIVALDDDFGVLSAFARGLKARGFKVIGCSTVEDAERALLQRPSFVLVDLMLEGGSGDHLSNSFVEHTLTPQGIGFARITSAPKLVPPHLVGDLPIFDKNAWEREFESFCDEIVRHLQG